MSQTEHLTRPGDDDRICDCDCSRRSSLENRFVSSKENRFVSSKESRFVSSKETRLRSSLDVADPVVMPDFDVIMDEVKHKKCAVVELVRRQIDRFDDGEDMNYVRGEDENEAFRKKMMWYLTYLLAGLLLFFLLYALCGTCNSGGYKGKRCWLFVSNIFSCRSSRHPGGLHSTF